MHSYKITPRAVNAHAYVNAVFVFEVDTSADFTVTSKPVILYGGINPSFVSCMKLCQVACNGHWSQFLITTDCYSCLIISYGVSMILRQLHVSLGKLYWDLPTPKTSQLK